MVRMRGPEEEAMMGLGALLEFYTRDALFQLPWVTTDYADPHLENAGIA